VDPAPTNGRATTTALAPADPVDLHLHTLASDGAWTPAALIDHLAANGFRVAAVCDHDTQRSVLETMRRANRRGIQIVPGVEVTTRWRDRQVHLLVYGIRPDRADAATAPFRAVLAELDALLLGLADDARQRLEASGHALPSLEEIAAGRPLWPFHVLSAVIREGHAKNLKTAAELVTELGGGFNADLPLPDVVSAAHAAGGICVVAHPGRDDSIGVISADDVAAMVAEIPIDGLEAHYRSYTDAQTALYRDLANQHRLLISCGSDSHAPKHPVDPRPWRAAWCADLLGRLGIEIASDGATDEIWKPGLDPLAVPASAAATAGDQSEPPGEQIADAAEAIEQDQRLSTTVMGAEDGESSPNARH